MSREQELFERYEDAFFAMMMDQIAQEEGRKALELNDRLRNEEEDIPETLRKRGEKTIRKAFSATKRTRVGHGLWKGVQVAAVVVLLVTATLTVSMAGFPDLKATVFNMVLNTFQDHADFSFVPVREGQDPDLVIDLGWLPEGFMLEEGDGFEKSAWQRYRNPDSGAVIYIEKLYPITVGADSEDAEIESIEIQGYPAQLITKDHEVRIVWLDSGEGIVYIVFTEWVSADDAIKIAENLS